MEYYTDASCNTNKTVIAVVQVENHKFIKSEIFRINYQICSGTAELHAIIVAARKAQRGDIIFTDYQNTAKIIKKLESDEAREIAGLVFSKEIKITWQHRKANIYRKYVDYLAGKVLLDKPFMEFFWYKQQLTISQMSAGGAK